MTLDGAFSLEGRVALVTGGGTGLGRAGALALAAAGAQVYVAGRTRSRLEETVGLVRAAGGTAEAVVIDVADPSSIDAGLADVVAAAPHLDVLVNNAGVAYEARLADADPAEIDRLIATNLTGLLLTCRAFVRATDAGRERSIVNVSSLASVVGVKGQVAYSASKAGVDAATRSLALEHAGRGLRVNAVAPGYFDTDMPAAVTQDPDLLQSLTRKIPMRRLGRPAEIGPTFVFLASPASSYLTGAVIHLDGGFTAQ